MGTALLVQFYEELPQQDDGTAAPGARRKKVLDAFKRQVAARYTEGTLQRLLDCTHAPTRRAAVLAMGLLGSMESNRAVAAMLRDGDAVVRQLAADALWSLWFRGGSAGQNDELQRLIRLDDPQKALSGLDRLVAKAPEFAEALNQRAIVYFRLGEYQKAVADCEATLKLNPCHFGALSGMGQCYMKLRKPRPALKAFRSAYRINPGLEGVAETIRALEDVLGGEGRKDDKR